MPFNEQLADRVSVALDPLKNVQTKMMFSGVAFLVDGKMCINVTSQGLMCRVDPNLHETLVEIRGCRSMVMKGRELKGWVVIEESELSSKKALDYWISLALDFNKHAKASKKKKS